MEVNRAFNECCCTCAILGKELIATNSFAITGKRWMKLKMQKQSAATDTAAFFKTFSLFQVNTIKNDKFYSVLALFVSMFSNKMKSFIV